MAPASAATVSNGGWYVTYEAGAGEVNNISLSMSSGNIVFSDAFNISITAPAGCSVSGSTATCPAAGIAYVYVHAGDLNDTIDVHESVVGLSQVSLNGQAGDDTFNSDATLDEVFSGGDGEDVINAGAGNDHVHGGANGDTLSGEGGNDGIEGQDGRDALLGGDGNDTLDPGAGVLDDVFGGAGVDSVAYNRTTPVSVSINGAADDGASEELDNVHPDVEGIFGGTADDVLIGSASRNYIHGGGGNDEISGSGGNDQLYGGAGVNTLDGGDGDDALFGDASGQDDFIGGAGQDYVPLIRSGDVSVTMNGVADDGEAGEGDNIRPDIEEITTGSGNDTIVGSKAGNEFETGDGDDSVNGGGGSDGITGGRGRDALNGGQGIDSIHGQAGLDTLTSQDKSKDYVTCGGSVDSVNADARDQVTFDCEKVS